jgi:CBS domain-containing protein
MKIKEIMTSNLLQYCRPETKLHNVAKSMKKANCGVLPVVNKSKKVVGMVTDRDICLALANKNKKPISLRNVGDIISSTKSSVVSVKVDDDLKTALKQMRTNKIGRLPVIDKTGKLKGILSIHNLISKSNDGKKDWGNLSDTDENIAKTILALADHYSLNKLPKSKFVSAGRSETWEESM